MNYCTINGKQSTLIDGLLIQSLPPISKPLMRTQVEEVDGRDGDIITKLGYSAYDKQMVIGLYGDYDVNEVIAYFDTEGIVTFSNEPDKYYKFQILEQIDFERLIRFKTATVTFHVQPFKYSTVEERMTKSVQLLGFGDWSQTKNGVTLIAQNGTIIIEGTSTSATEFYLPINALQLSKGDYTLTAQASGDMASACSIRLIGSVPTDADSFGGTYLALQNDATVSLRARLSASKTFNYLWFYITAGNTMNFVLDASVVDDSGDLSVITVTNTGNTVSKPSITLYGVGTINLYLNGNQIFVINLENEGYVTINGEQMEAYQGGILRNRIVTGDYDNLVFNTGKNTLYWIGVVSRIDIDNFSRWI